MNKPTKTVLALAFCCASLLLLWSSTGQLRNIRAAEGHAPIVARALAPYPEFNDIHVGSATGNGGYFAVTGRVRVSIIDVKISAQTAYRTSRRGA